jgi:Mg/Co/Ni transporter MgtE
MIPNKFCKFEYTPTRLPLPGHGESERPSKMMDLFPHDQVERIQTILADLESSAEALMSPDFVTAKKTTSVMEILKEIRGSHREPRSLSYLYVVDDKKTLLGVVDLREIVLAADTVLLGDLMVHLPFPHRAMTGVRIWRSCSPDMDFT